MGEAGAIAEGLSLQASDDVASLIDGCRERAGALRLGGCLVVVIGGGFCGGTLDSFAYLFVLFVCFSCCFSFCLFLLNSFLGEFLFVFSSFLSFLLFLLFLLLPARVLVVVVMVVVMVPQIVLVLMHRCLQGCF